MLCKHVTKSEFSNVGTDRVTLFLSSCNNIITSFILSLHKQQVKYNLCIVEVEVLRWIRKQWLTKWKVRWPLKTSGFIFWRTWMSEQNFKGKYPMCSIWTTAAMSNSFIVNYKNIWTFFRIRLCIDQNSRWIHLELSCYSAQGFGAGLNNWNLTDITIYTDVFKNWLLLQLRTTIPT